MTYDKAKKREVLSLKLNKDEKTDIRHMINDYILVHARKIVEADEMHDTRNVEIHQRKIYTANKARVVLEL